MRYFRPSLGDALAQVRAAEDNITDGKGYDYVSPTYVAASVESALCREAYGYRNGHIPVR